MSEHALVVEPDEQISDAICKLLKRAGIETVSTDSAGGALIALRNIPALMVIDLLLPDDEGIEVVQTVRELGMPTQIAMIASEWKTTLPRSDHMLHPDALFGVPFDFQDFTDWLIREFGSPAAPTQATQATLAD